MNGSTEDAADGGATEAVPDAVTLFESLRSGLTNEIDSEVASILHATLFSENKRRRDLALNEIRRRIGLPE